jgi:hypothetical protein
VGAVIPASPSACNSSVVAHAPASANAMSDTTPANSAETLSRRRWASSTRSVLSTSSRTVAGPMAATTEAIHASSAWDRGTTTSQEPPGLQTFAAASGTQVSR